MTAPVKRGPGRPRKHPLPEAPAAPETEVAEPTVTAASTPEPSDDPRIGQEVHPTATHVGFDDGTQYLAQGGVITERVD